MWKFTIFAVIEIVVAVMLCLPTAQAGIITTPDYLRQEEVADMRIELVAGLQREDVRDRLVELGVDPAAVEARVAAMSDVEVISLATEIDSMPAGAEIGGATLILLIILIILLV